MTSVELEDVTFLFAVALLHGYQLMMNAKRVGDFRRKYSVPPPLMIGPRDFQRCLRVQQNDLEFAIPFQILLWTSGVCFHQGVAAILGLIFIYARYNYAQGYIEDAEKRLKPFYMSVRVIRVLLALCVAGLINIFVRQYLDVDLAAMIKKQTKPLVKQAYKTLGLKDEL